MTWRSLIPFLAILPLHAQTSLTGAGATFPAPIYQKWFNDYQTVGNAQINYQPNGSGGGIKAVTEGTTDFGASDMPMTDEQLAAYKAKNGYNILLFPTVLGAAVPSYNVPGVTGELNFTPTVLADIFLGKDYDLERSAAGQSESWGETARRQDRGGSSSRGERHDVLLDGLSFQSESGVGVESRQETRR